MRTTHGRLVLLALLSASACFGYKRVETAPRAGARVRIVLASATDVTTIATDGTRLTQLAVLEASGTIQAAAADTVVLRLGELRTAAGAVPGSERLSALLPTDRIARVEERKFEAGKTALAGVGAATLAIAAFLVIIIGALTQGY